MKFPPPRPINRPVTPVRRAHNLIRAILDTEHPPPDSSPVTTSWMKHLEYIETEDFNSFLIDLLSDIHTFLPRFLHASSRESRARNQQTITRLTEGLLRLRSMTCADFNRFFNATYMITLGYCAEQSDPLNTERRIPSATVVTLIRAANRILADIQQSNIDQPTKSAIISALNDIIHTLERYIPGRSQHVRQSVLSSFLDLCRRIRNLKPQQLSNAETALRSVSELVEKADKIFADADALPALADLTTQFLGLPPPG